MARRCLSARKRGPWLVVPEIMKGLCVGLDFMSPAKVCQEIQFAGYVDVKIQAIGWDRGRPARPTTADASKVT